MLPGGRTVFTSQRKTTAPPTDDHLQWRGIPPPIFDRGG
jgi:hypothetical protein